MAEKKIIGNTAQRNQECLERLDCKQDIDNLFLNYAVFPIGRLTIALALFAVVTSMVYLETRYKPFEVSYEETETVEAAPVTDEEWAAQPHYNPEWLRRYQRYYDKNPELSVYEVIWRVNVRLDYAPYVSMANLTSDHPFLVTQRYKLAADFVPPDLVEIDRYIYAVPAAAEAFAAMQAAAAEKRYEISAVSGYRSYREQESVYREKEWDYYWDTDETDRAAARPGSSEHQTGRALDIRLTVDSPYDEWQMQNAAQNWLRDNAPDYGFIMRYTNWETDITGYYNEPWHLTYVGKDISFDMMRRGMTTLEEYAGSLPYGTDWDSIMGMEGEQ